MTRNWESAVGSLLHETEVTERETARWTKMHSVVEREVKNGEEIEGLMAEVISGMQDNLEALKKERRQMEGVFEEVEKVIAKERQRMGGMLDEVEKNLATCMEIVGRLDGKRAAQAELWKKVQEDMDRRRF